MKHRHQILVTGANGFIGRHLCRKLSEAGKPLLAGVRSSGSTSLHGTRAKIVELGALESSPDLQTVLADVDCIIHLAAMPDCGPDANPGQLKALQAINVDATAHLAQQAAEAGVRRLIFLSSIKVHGEATTRPFRADDAQAPADPYARSKMAAEHALDSIAAASGQEVVIIRPPLTYGPNARTNMRRLLKLVHSGLPLPFGSIRNKRSMVALDNLCDLLLTCIDHPHAVGPALLVCDGQDLSTPEFIRLLGQHLGKKPRLLPFPPALLLWLGKLAGKQGEIARLTQSLQVDMQATCNRLNWFPPVSVSEALHATAHDWLNNT